MITKKETESEGYIIMNRNSDILILLLLLALLAELPELMETDWGNAESAIERFMPLVNGTPYAEDLTAILASVKDFDNAALQGQAAALQRRLRGESL